MTPLNQPPGSTTSYQDEEKLVPLWGVSAENQIITIGLLVFGLFAAAFLGLTQCSSSAGDDATVGSRIESAVSAAAAGGSAADVNGVDATATVVAATTQAQPTAAPADADGLDEQGEDTAASVAASTPPVSSPIPSIVTEAPATAVPSTAGPSTAVPAAVPPTAIPVVEPTVAPEPTAAAPPAPEPTSDEPTAEPTDVVAELNATFAQEPIQFAKNSAEILPDSVPRLDAAVMLLLTLSESTKVEIQGHTDSDGEAALNLALSQERADAVRAYLIGSGINEAMLTAVGYGETSLKVDPETGSPDKAANRRIEFVVLEG